MKLVAWWAAVAVASAARFRQASVKDSEDFKLRLGNFDNVQYSAAFSLGNQTLPVIYDTGSFEIIVLSTLCVSCSRSHGVYNSSKSSSFAADAGVVAEHLFGSGPVRSERGYETVHLGGRSSPYAAAHTPFWQVVSHNIAVWNHNAHFSGIVGLGHPGQVPDMGGQVSEADSMLSAMQISSFAFCLERGAGAPGWLSVGPSTQSLPRSSASFQTLRVVGKEHWGVKMTDVEVPGLAGGAGVSACTSSCGAIVDSGTSLISAPPSAVGMVTALARLVRRDCSNLHALPVLRMKLDGKPVELPPAAYVIRTKVSSSSILRRMFSEPSHECSVGFMTLDKDSQFGPVWILGMPFLRYYYTVFDRANKTIHIAPSTPSCEVAGSGQPVSLLNSSGLQGAGAAVQSGRLFAAEDYAPTEVDLDSARIPSWASSPQRQVSL